MAVDAQAVESLGKLVNELPAAEVSEGLAPVLDPRRDLLWGIVANAEGPSIEPVNHLLEGIHSAIGRVESPRIRSEMGEQAVRAICGTLMDTRFPTRTYETRVQLIDTAIDFTRLIVKPQTRVNATLEVSSEAVSTSEEGDISGEEKAVLLAKADYMIAEATVAASNISHPARRAHAFVNISKQAIENLLHAPSTYDSVQARPITLYDEASQAAKKLKKSQERLETQSSIATEEAKSAIVISETNPKLSGQLLDASFADLDRMMQDDSLPAVEQCVVLVNIGSEFSQLVNSFQSITHEDEVVNNDARQRLIDKTVELYKTARQQAQTKISFADRMKLGMNGNNLRGVANTAVASARSLLKHDFAAALEITDVSYDLAIAEGVWGNSGARVASSIWDLAEKQPNVEQALDLFMLVHDKENELQTSGETSHVMETNVRSWFDYLSERGMAVSSSAEDISLPPESLPFLNFAVDTAANSDEMRFMQTQQIISALQYLSRLIGDVPLKERIDQLIIQKDEQERQTKEPKNDLERLARLAVGKS